jgi:hypothetical protein
VIDWPQETSAHIQQETTLLRNREPNNRETKEDITDDQSRTESSHRSDSYLRAPETTGAYAEQQLREGLDTQLLQAMPVHLISRLVHVEEAGVKLTTNTTRPQPATTSTPEIAAAATRTPRHGVR